MEYVLHDSHVVPRVVSAESDRAICKKDALVREYGTDIKRYCKDDCEQRAKGGARFQSFNQWLSGFSRLAGMLRKWVFWLCNFFFADFPPFSSLRRFVLFVLLSSQ